MLLHSRSHQRSASLRELSAQAVRAIETALLRGNAWLVLLAIFNQLG